MVSTAAPSAGSGRGSKVSKAASTAKSTSVALARQDMVDEELADAPQPEPTKARSTLKKNEKAKNKNNKWSPCPICLKSPDDLEARYVCTVYSL